MQTKTELWPGWWKAKCALEENLCVAIIAQMMHDQKNWHINTNIFIFSKSLDLLSDSCIPHPFLQSTHSICKRLFGFVQIIASKRLAQCVQGRADLSRGLLGAGAAAKVSNSLFEVADPAFTANTALFESLRSPGWCQCQIIGYINCLCVQLSVTGHLPWLIGEVDLARGLLCPQIL